MPLFIRLVPTRHQKCTTIHNKHTQNAQPEQAHSLVCGEQAGPNFHNSKPETIKFVSKEHQFHCRH